MPIIVDKNIKRKKIAFSIKDLILEKGIKNLTITEIVNKAKIARGSFYDYFETKEDVLFEIIVQELKDFKKELTKKKFINLDSKNKVFKFFEFSLSEEEKFFKERTFYKEYLTIALTSNKEKIINFNKKFNNELKDILLNIINEGICNNELKKEALCFVDSMLSAEKGFLVIQWIEKRDTKNEFKIFIDNLFKLIKKD